MTWNLFLLAILSTWVTSAGSWQKQASLGSWQVHDHENHPLYIDQHELLKFLHFSESKCYKMEITVSNRSIRAEVMNLAYRNFYPVEIKTERKFVLDLKFYNFRDSRFSDHRLCRLFMYQNKEELKDMLDDDISVYEEDVYGVNYFEVVKEFQKICKKMGGLVGIDKSIKCFDENPSELLKVLVPATPYLPFISKTS